MLSKVILLALFGVANVLSFTISGAGRRFTGSPVKPLQSASLTRFNDPFQFLDRPLLHPYGSFGGLEKFLRGVNEVFLDIYEKDDSYDVLADLPGYPKESIDIKILNDDTLTIAAEKCEYFEEDNDKFHRRERTMGKVQRSIQLPHNVDQEKIKASYDHGVLKIEIPKSETKSSSEKKIKLA